MTTTPTSNPIPSEAPQDLKFNAGKIDEFVTSQGLTYVDRLGVQRYTIEGMNYLSQQALSIYGYVVLAGVSFTTGATIHHPNEVLFDAATGDYFKWTASLASEPKIVPANSTPTSSGGVGAGKWLGVGDSSLRALLSSSDGAKHLGAGQGLSQADVNRVLEENISQVGRSGIISDFGFWSLSANNSSPGTGEFSCPTGYLATSTSVVFHATDKNSRDMENVIGLLAVGSHIIAVAKTNSAKRTVLKVTSVSVTTTTATVNYTVSSQSGSNVAVGEEYKFLLQVFEASAGFTTLAPNDGKDYIQRSGVWQEIKHYELGRAMFTKTGSGFSIKKISSDNSFLINWTTLRLYKGDAGVISIQDAVNITLQTGYALYVDVTETQPLQLHTAIIDTVVKDAVIGTKIILTGNYAAGIPFGAVASDLISSERNKNARRLISGAITSIVLSGADYTISTGVGRSYIESNNGSYEHEISPVTEVLILPGQGLVVDFTNGSKNSAGQYLPVVEFISSNESSGWVSGDKYILFGSTGLSGSTFGVYKTSSSNGLQEDQETIIVQKTTDSYLNIFMKKPKNGTTKYVRYHLDRRLNEEKRSDVWRVNGVNECARETDYRFSTGLTICGTGEFECALGETGKSDYMGGWRHGNEMATYAAILVDGTLIDSSYVGNFKCSRIELLQQSELYEVDNPIKNVRAKAYRRWVFENGELELFNHIVFSSDFNVSVAFLGMLPISRISSDNITQVTDTVFRDPMYLPEDVSIAGFPIIYDKSSIIKWSGPSGWGAELEIKSGYDLPNRQTWIQNTAEYNKGYFDITGPSYSAQSGASLTAITLYKIFDKN